MVEMCGHRHMENIQQKRQIILKSTLTTCMAASTGIYLSGAFVLAAQSYLDNVHTANVGQEIFIYNILSRLFLFLFVSISPYILFSQSLPRHWLFASFVGALLAGFLTSIRHLLIVEEYPLMSLYLGLLDTGVLMGFLSSIPQWILLKRASVARNYYWLIANCIGWGIVGLFLNQELSLSYVLMGRIWAMFFDWFQHYGLWEVVEICAFIPLGAGIGLFFTQMGLRKTHKDENEVN